MDCFGRPSVGILDCVIQNSRVGGFGNGMNCCFGGVEICELCDGRIRWFVVIEDEVQEDRNGLDGESEDRRVRKGRACGRGNAGYEALVFCHRSIVE